MRRETYLTYEEQCCIDHLSDAARVYFKDCEHDSDAGEMDMAEFASRIHDLQA